MLCNSKFSLSSALSGVAGNGCFCFPLQIDTSTATRSLYVWAIKSCRNRNPALSRWKLPATQLQWADKFSHQGEKPGRHREREGMGFTHFTGWEREFTFWQCDRVNFSLIFRAINQANSYLCARRRRKRSRADIKTVWTSSSECPSKQTVCS